MAYDDGNWISDNEDPAQQETAPVVNYATSLPNTIGQYGTGANYTDTNTGESLSGWADNLTSADLQNALNSTYANDPGTAASNQNFDDWFSSYLSKNPTLGLGASSGSASSPGQTSSLPTNIGQYGAGGGAYTNPSTGETMTGINAGNATSADEAAGAANSGNWWDSIVSGLSSGASGLVSKLGGLSAADLAKLGLTGAALANSGLVGSGGSSKITPSAETTAQQTKANDAAQAYLDLMKQQYAAMQPYQQQLLQAGQAASNLQSSAAQNSIDRGNQVWNQYQSTFQPINSQIASEASTLGNEADQQHAAEVAGATVSGQVGAQQTAAAAKMAQMGINPNDPRFAAQLAGNATSGASAIAAAENNARTAEKSLGQNYRLQAANLGNTLAGQANQLTAGGAGSAGSAVNSASSALSGSMAPLNAVSSGVNTYLNNQNSQNRNDYLWSSANTNQGNYLNQLRLNGIGQLGTFLGSTSTNKNGVTTTETQP